MLTPQSNEEIEKNIEKKLIFEPELDESKIYISVQDGIVTLLGTVGSYWAKCIADRAIKSVRGVKAIANNLKVDLDAKSKRTDTEIASTVINALKCNIAIPTSAIQVTVEDGCVTLTGKVGWQHERYRAEKVIQNLAGVKSILNLITLKPRVAPKDIKETIIQEFHRNATIDAEKVNVEVEGGKVILRGKLHSWAEIKEAKRAAWSVPGVSEVEDQLILI